MRPHKRRRISFMPIVHQLIPCYFQFSGRFWTDQKFPFKKSLKTRKKKKKKKKLNNEWLGQQDRTGCGGLALLLKPVRNRVRIPGVLGHRDGLPGSRLLRQDWQLGIQPATVFAQTLGLIPQLRHRPLPAFPAPASWLADPAAIQ